jgi:steroid 5-alpha reductase family enzyme
MFDLHADIAGLATILVMAGSVWLLSVIKHDVSIVDSAWSLFIAGAMLSYFLVLKTTAPRAWLTVILVATWAARLAIHITLRNWGEAEDKRYQAIRERNQPNFVFKSLYLVFGLQAVLSWIVSLPVLAAIASSSQPNWLDAFGLAVFIFGFLFEATADFQLSRFKGDTTNQGRVMDRGLWRYTRHPNYFGEFCVWWGIYLLALAAGGWWSVVSPLLMSLLLMRISGVVLLEKDIHLRRPGYRDYVARTPAFFPRVPRK